METFADHVVDAIDETTPIPRLLSKGKSSIWAPAEMDAHHHVWEKFKRS